MWNVGFPPPPDHQQWCEDPSYLLFWAPQSGTAGCLADQFQLNRIPCSFIVVSSSRIMEKVVLSQHAEEAWNLSHTFWAGC